MVDHERELYLRNLVALAKADDIVMIEEHALISRVSAEIGSNKEEVARVVGGPRPDGVDLKGLSRFSTRVRCLEDMIELAMVDDEVDLQEKRFLFVAAQSIGLPKETVATMIAEAKERTAQG